MPRAAKPEPVAADPLADLRDDEPATSLPAVAGDAPQEALDAPLPPSQPLTTPEAQDEARRVLVAAWHADTVALGFLHKGDACGCGYLARLSVGAILPVTAQEE